MRKYAISYLMLFAIVALPGCAGTGGVSTKDNCSAFVDQANVAQLAQGVVHEQDEYAIAPTTLEEEIAIVSRLWAEYVQKNFKVGDALALFERALSGKYRDKVSGRLGGNPDAAIEYYYLIDDFHQLRVVVDEHNTLSSLPVVQPRQYWLRGPDGNLQRMVGAESLKTLNIEQD